MFGGNTNLPNFIKNQFPAQETTIKLFELALYISTLHAAWRAFIESELCNKLKLVIHKNIPPSESIYTSVMKYITNETTPEWKGPGRVLG